MKRIIFSLIALLFCIWSFAQSNDSLYVYSGGQIIRSFLRSKVDSINCSKTSIDGVKGESYVTQVIFAEGRQYKDALINVDSVVYPKGKEMLLEDGFKTTQGVVSYLGDYYYESLKTLSVTLYDSTYVANGGVKSGKYLTFEVTEENGMTFKNGIPLGTFTLAPASFSTKPYQCHSASCFNVQTGKKVDVTGILTIAKEGDIYKFIAKVVPVEGDSIISVFSSQIDNKNLKYLNGSCLSTLLSDKTVNVKTAGIRCNAASTRVAGTNEWLVTLAGDGVAYDVKADSLSGKGEVIQALLYVPQGEMPTGTYTVSYSKKAGVVNPFFFMDKKKYVGTGYFSFVDSVKNTTGMAPTGSGAVEIMKNTDDTYSIVAKFKDDNVEEPHTFSAAYNGLTNIYNSLETPLPTDGFNTKAVTVSYMGDFYAESLKSWDIAIYDSTHVATGGVSLGKVLHITVTTVSDKTYKSGIPVGTYDLNPQAFATKPNQCHEAYFYDQKTQEKINLTGELTILYEGGRYRFYTKVKKASSDSIISVFSSGIDNVNLKYLNGSCQSTLTDNKSIDTKHVAFRCNKKSTRAKGTNEWLVTMATDGVKYDVVGDVYSGSGEVVQALIYVTEGETPNGKYTVSYSKTAGIAYPFFYQSNKKYSGTGYYAFKDSVTNITASAPTDSGDIVITKNADETYTVVAHFKDDNLDEPHIFSAEFTGNVDIYNSLETGTFNSATFGYEGQKNANTKSWTMKFVNETDGSLTSALTLDVVAPSLSVFTSGLSAGTYNFSSSIVPNSFIGGVLSKINAADTTKLSVIGGSFTIEIHNTVYIVRMNLQTSDGNTYIGLYNGSVTMKNMNYHNATFIGKNASVSISKVATANGMTNWYLKAYDGGYPENGSVVVLDLYTPEQADASFPEGTYKLGEKPGIDKNQYSWFAIFTENDGGIQYTPNTGSVKISKSVAGYKIDFDFSSVKGYTLKGEYDGAVVME